MRTFHNARHCVGCYKRSENIDRPYSHQQFCTNCSHKKNWGFRFHCLCIRLFIYVRTFIWRSFKMTSDFFCCELLHFFCKQIQTLVSWWLAGWWIANPARTTASKEMLLLDYDIYILYSGKVLGIYIRSWVNTKTNRKSKIHDWQTIVLW